MNSKNTRQFAELTVMAVVALILPIAYIKGRPYIIEKSDQLYYRLFSVRADQYEQVKEQQRQAKLEEKERIKEATQQQLAGQNKPTSILDEKEIK